MFRDKNIPTSFIAFTISLFLILLFAAKILAVEKWRESNYKGGWQIWIEAKDFDKREGGTLKTLAEAELFQEWKEWFDKNDPFLAEDIVISRGGKEGHLRYEFDAPIVASTNASVYARVQSTWEIQAGGLGTQSWFVGLNIEEMNNSLVLDAPGKWSWNTDRGNLPPKEKLKAGKNFVKVTPREWEPQRDPAIDVIMVSDVDYKPTDEDFHNAKPNGLAVQPEGKLATTWATIKSDF